MANAYTLVQALEAAGKNLTRQDLINAVNSNGGKWTGPGHPTDLGLSDHSVDRDSAGTTGLRNSTKLGACKEGLLERCQPVDRQLDHLVLARYATQRVDAPLHRPDIDATPGRLQDPT